MAKVIIEVCACDRCGKEPANTWVITGPGGPPRRIDLCDQHGGPIGNAYALARPVPPRPAKTARRQPVDPPVTPPSAVVAEPIWR